MEPRMIVLDTNFLLIPLQFGVDIFQEIERICPFAYELAVVAGTLNELDNIAFSGSRKDKDAARVGKSLLQAKGIRVIPMENCRTVDDALVHWGKTNAIVATQDKDLKRVLKSLCVQRIVLRKKSYLLLEGETRCITKQK